MCWKIKRSTTIFRRCYARIRRDGDDEAGGELIAYMALSRGKHLRKMVVKMKGGSVGRR
jgi:hypothetical protein